MQLKKIQVSGFKSFVDPTAIRMPARLIGIVGPNGCGKSNVIDAIRWVMGESSAKNLRGDNMMDVIFNGSSARKPVSKASVELFFDNTAGKAPDAYAKFTEISVRRALARDGQSDYFINNTRCRRRDITDIFRGTGLGARSYSIIEQGMVSRIVEAKPEELRLFVEEAAGISKYKDRRRETETRIRHTRENLSRVEDIRSELETQLRRLQRQSQAARRYKTLKQEERLLLAQLICLKWQSLQQSMVDQDQRLETCQSRLKGKQDELKNTNQEIEQIRAQQTDEQENLNTIQAEYYRAGADISALEQRIEHSRESNEQRELELSRIQNALAETEEQLIQDAEKRVQLERKLGELAPTLADRENSLDKAVNELQELEQAFHQWQLSWDAFGKESTEPVTQQGIHQARIEQLEAHIAQLDAREHRLRVEHEEVETDIRSLRGSSLGQELASLDSRYEQQMAYAQNLENEIKTLRQHLDRSKAEMDDMKSRFAASKTRCQSLLEMQAVAMGDDDEVLVEWLAQYGLQDTSRLASRLKVEEGWERSIDSVLAQRLAALCVDDLNDLSRPVKDRPGNALAFVESRPQQIQLHEAKVKPDAITHKIQCDGLDVSTLLVGVRVASDVEDALKRRFTLDIGELFVTPTGEMIGPNWMALPGEKDAESGLLAREEEIQQLQEELLKLEQTIDENQELYLDSTRKLMHAEEERERVQNELAQMSRQRTEWHNRLGREESQMSQLEQRLAKLSQEMQEIRVQSGADSEEIASAQKLLMLATEQTGSVEERRESLLGERDQLRERLATARGNVESARDSRHDIALESERLQTELNSLDTAVQRLNSNKLELGERREDIRQKLDSVEDTERAHTQEMDKLHLNRRAVENKLAAVRQQMDGMENSLKHTAEKGADLEQVISELRDEFEQQKLNRQELLVRQQTLEEQLTEEEHDLEALKRDLPEDATETVWSEKSEQLAAKIARIGPVNLVAIEEFEEQSERKIYLDNQHEDLIGALQTLENAIRKIDKETRERFKTTFDRLNTAFQGLFPRLFGGGSAVLELTGEELLDTGITVMARPPGKRNSTIHLLSGGEKALTAVALLFAFFQLNPAPFCILDEVDAPLDDANVERYCETLKSLASHTQLMFITHNKITMEAADVLIGVTMGEPGVSRLVSVDVDEALQMAS